MRRYGKVGAFTLSAGQSHIIIGIGEYGLSSSHHYVISTNGDTWTAAFDPMPNAPTGMRYTGWGIKDLKKMPPEMRLPLLWGKKALKGKPPGTVVTADAAATKPVDVYSFGAADTDKVTFIGYRKKKLAHSIPALLKIFTESVNRCQEVWQWRPINAEVEIHTTSRAMGLAFNPGQGRHRISLHTNLLNGYDLPSIKRVILHELCHHYRDEAWPQNRYEDHDDIFCRELQRVDSALAPDAEKRGLQVAAACSAFYEQRDIAVVEGYRKKIHKNEIPPVWAPAAGYVEVAHLKSGKFRYAWMPKIGAFDWTTKVQPFSDIDLLILAKHFDPTQLDQVPVIAKRDPKTMQPMWQLGAGSPPPPNLLGLLQFLLTRYLRHLPKTAAYMQDVLTVHTKVSA
jgi:predicted SprT family Zn-dependent metalloprotease